ncbi:AAA family ATPase [uncultured Paludibaculum sp.]|uniref:AAA family ATPase n=1 Tax=uncultured Paludibaculum sp. TaxID=1765020 RepID=UPI002AAB9496|nr:AAA family ATPase [uncultured Paludibaculum sp.]
MSHENLVRPLHLHTIDSLCADLISGRPIAAGKQNDTHSLGSAASRAILNWYRINRSKWASNVMERDVESIVDAATSQPPILAAEGSDASHSPHRLRLAKMEAHQFGGLHAISSKSDVPTNFVFEPTKLITLFEGWNGSGKTSLLNAIIWCLTGQLLRAQRKPEPGNIEFECRIERETAGSPADATYHKLTPVSPLPSPTRFHPDATQSKLPLDTWVELTFVDESGQSLQPIRRTQTRSTRGTVTETEPALSALRVDPIALRIGTTMPGIIPFIQAGSVSELGQSITELTGLAELVELARHATKVKQKLAGDFTKSRTAEIAKQDGIFTEVLGELRELIVEHPVIDPGLPLPTPSEDRSLEVALQTLEDRFVSLKSKALEEARVVLGQSFDPSSSISRDDLEMNIQPALAQLSQIQQLESAARLAGLATLSEEQLSVAEALVSQIRSQAVVLAELATDSDIARRKQLYARVASWMQQHKLEGTDNCMVCGASLESAIDVASGRPVRDHLQQMLAGDAELLGVTVRNWSQSWIGELAQSLPDPLRKELHTELPATPGTLIQNAVSVELFKTLPFTGILSALRPDAESVCIEAINGLPPFNEPPRKKFGREVAESADELEQMLNRLDRAIAFSRWRQAHHQEVKAVSFSTLGTKAREGGSINARSPLRWKLSALEATVKGAQPITRALVLSKRMSRELMLRREKEARIEAYRNTGEGLGEVIALGGLAQQQVEDLRGALHERALHWRSRFYQNAYVSAGHALVGSEMDSKGTLSILVGSEGTTAPAQHVANASALRASLMGFFLAFWEHVLNTRGGLQLLLLDDPQELLDEDNRERLAHSLPELVGAGAQLFVTTHDRRFARIAVSEARKQGFIEHRSVHPVNSGRTTITTALTVESLDQKRVDFENKVDDATVAQEYAAEARVFIEARLADLFDSPAYPAYSVPTKAPTLADHLGRLQGLVASPPNDLFRSPPLANFCKDKALLQGAACLALLNKAHHGHKATITYSDVHSVREDLKRLRRGIEELHEEFRRWRWREPGQEIPANVVSLSSSPPPHFRVRIYPDLAAFTGLSPGGETQALDDAEFESSWFSDKAFFYLKNDNLGFAAPSGSIVVVEREPKPGNDRNLVIALTETKTYARRLLRSSRGGIVSLAAQNPDPRISPPTVFLEPFTVRIHRIVGVLFGNMYPPREKQEAVQVDRADVLAQVSTAYRVRDDSALPLALPRQLVLGGPRITPAELDGYVGQLVALTLEEGSGIFKRVGPQLPKAMAPLRKFESIGGLGASEIVATEAHDGRFPGVPVMAYARQIIGVVYEVTGETPRLADAEGHTARTKRAGH